MPIARAKATVRLALRDAIAAAGRSCAAFTDGMTVSIDDENAYGPDAVVRCVDRLAGGELLVEDPVIVTTIVSQGDLELSPPGLRLAPPSIFPS